MGIMTIAAASQTANTTPTLDSLYQLIADDMMQVNQVIIEQSRNEISLISDLAAHIISAGGKRMRPALTIACARLCGYEGTRHIYLAACVEFIHTATLLHDDVVDESHLRRGNATANDIWGNKSSVLVGDFLFSRAFQLMVADGSLRTLKILSDTSAIIAQGEVQQLMTVHAPQTSEETYLEVIRAKTAALFSAASELGAVVSERADLEEAMIALGLNLGIAFQLVDDALDYAASEAALGKNIGDDFREGKITLPVILAYQMANEEEKAFFKRTLEDEDQREGDLQQAIEILNHYQTIELTLERAQAFAEKARHALRSFPPSPMRSALEETVDFCVHRAH